MSKAMFMEVVIILSSQGIYFTLQLWGR